MKIKTIFEIQRTMGLKYIVFRIRYFLQGKIGWLRLKFPKYQGVKEFVTLKKWRGTKSLFFVAPEHWDFEWDEKNEDELRKKVLMTKEGKFLYFHKTWYSFVDWHTNPLNGYRYASNLHWSKVSDMDPQAGDIKFVWEASRFCFLYDLIRYDFHCKEDQSTWVFEKIENWIDGNPVNCGPNWKCGQEITLRVLNWTFALEYYRQSETLNERLFAKIINSIYRQVEHVAKNINFSRTVVRNNHALTETLGLYLVGLIYPFFPKSDQWKRKGKQWFEEEIQYQIYEDGTYLQFSMNYHRVVVQLLSWYIRLSELNNEPINETVLERSRSSLRFLKVCQDDKTGYLPNYGNNDGALFFPLSSCHYRDFRPQMEALARLVDIDLEYGIGPWGEECAWLGVKKKSMVKTGSKFTHIYGNGGCFILKESDTITFLRCGSYQHRPFQADNLHLDLWVNGENIMRDAGSFSYNTTPNESRYFTGTASHNTIRLGAHDQMKKERRFVWSHWIQESEGSWTEDSETFVFEGYYEGFKELGKGIRHHRKVTKHRSELRWIIEDRVENFPKGQKMEQIWHPSDYFLQEYRFSSTNIDGNKLEAEKREGLYSEFYGYQEKSPEIVFSSNEPYIRTVICLKNDNLF